MRKIEYQTVGKSPYNFYCITPCLFDQTIMVGSIMCQECDCCIESDEKQQYVVCKGEEQLKSKHN